MGSSCKQVTCELWSFYTIIVVILTPLLCLPMIIVIPTQESYCGYVLIVMTLYWVFEAIPMAATSLIPLVLFPFLGVMTASQTAVNYFKDTSALLMGGLLMAIAIETWNLHKRIALAVLMVCGTKPRWLLLGFMSVTWFLSMWISNTATTSMMLPIAQAVLLRLSQKLTPEDEESIHPPSHDTVNSNHVDVIVNDADYVKCEVQAVSETPGKDDGACVPNGVVHDVTMITNNEKANHKEHTRDLDNLIQEDCEIEETTGEKKKETNDSEISEEYRPMAKAFMLSICYSASIGGTGTLIGTTPQLVLLGQLDDRYGSGEHPLNFLSWMIFSLPAAVVFLIIAWLWLLFLYLDLNPKTWRKDGKCAWSCSCTTTEEEKIVKNVIKNEYKKLGPWTWAEMSTLVLFMTLCVLWIFRDIGGYGWAALFTEGYISDATPAILIGLILFFYPAEFPNFYGFRVKEDTSPIGPKPCLLNWPVVQKKMPWVLFLLLGGGFALAEGCEVSGLSEWIGEQLSALDYLSDAVIVVICTTVICFFTEVTSNTAVSTIFLPILLALADKICMNPMYISIPSTVLVTYAFMLPVATAPNAMVFANGQLTIPDMVVAGFGLSCIGILWINLWTNTYGASIFDMNTYPDWAKADNTTCTVNETINALSLITAASL
ncbi:Na(+)/citrate cotransporter-like [Glandiceps talaboti]